MLDVAAWGADARAAFERDGLVRLRGAIEPRVVADMAVVVWDFLERHTEIRRTDATTWPVGQLPVSLKKLKRNRTLRAGVSSPVLARAFDDLFGRGAWALSRSGPQLLVSFPSDGDWVVPHRPWHMDTGFSTAIEPPSAVKCFVPLLPLAPGGGATVGLAGSHRLQARHAEGLDPSERGGRTETWSELLRRDPWTDRLQRPGPEPARSAALVDGEKIVDSVPLRVVELGGDPGDVWITHLHLFHCPSSGVTGRPRLVAAQLVGPKPTER